MKPLKMIFFSISIVFIIIALPLLFVIIPIDKKHISLNKEARLLKVAEEKSSAVSAAILKHSESVQFLKEKLQEKPILPFLEDALNVSQISVESIKPNQGREGDEIHLVLQGEYRALIHFIAQLSQQPNAVVFVNLLIEKNRIEVILKDEHEVSVFVKAKSHANILKRLDAALVSINPPAFLLTSISALEDVQSPFVPRVFLKNKRGPFQSLEDMDWHLLGEVRKNDALLGVFLEAGHQSHYFGVGLPWENGDWSVIGITHSAIIFEEAKKHIRWRLVYRSSS